MIIRKRSQSSSGAEECSNKLKALSGAMDRTLCDTKESFAGEARGRASRQHGAKRGEVGEHDQDEHAAGDNGDQEHSYLTAQCGQLG